jgi:hypothetical protein
MGQDHARTIAVKIYPLAIMAAQSIFNFIAFGVINYYCAICRQVVEGERDECGAVVPINNDDIECAARKNVSDRLEASLARQAMDRDPRGA